MKKLIALLLSLCLIAGIMPVMAESTRMHENTAEGYCPRQGLGGGL